MNNKRYTPVVFNQGFSIFEVLVSIVVLGIAAAAITGMFSSAVRTSADPMIQQQAIAIAEAYMEEILLKDFADNMPGNSDTGVSEGETRATFNDIQDYNSLADDVVRDQNGAAIPQLASYSVIVSVSPDTLNGISNNCIQRIDVTVSNPLIADIQLSSFRSYYYEQNGVAIACL